jgi:PadR family transcriptional regulator, regulatory protein PadR
VAHPMTRSRDILQGTLDLLILKALSLEPLHGWGVAQRIQQVSDNVLTVNQGSLYPALHRLEKKKLVEADWQISDRGRRAKVYALTESGRRELGEETRRFREFVRAVEDLLGVRDLAALDGAGTAEP